MKWAWLHLLIVGRLNHVVLQLIAKFMSFCILINFKYNTNMHNAQKPSEWVSVWWRYPGCCDHSCAALGWGWVCEFLRHQSFPSRWWHWATGPTRTLHDIISPTLGDSKTASLHRVRGCWPASLSGSDTRARDWEARGGCRFQTNAFMPHFTFFARMFKNVDRDNNWNKRIMFVPSPRRKPAQQS